MTGTIDNRGGKADSIYRNLGANEQAVVDGVRSAFLRNAVIRLVGLKMRLQFSGWLQYMLPLPFAFGLLILAGFFTLISTPIVALSLTGLAGVLLLMAVVDIVTVKFRIRLPERRPQRRDTQDLFDLMRSRRSCRSFQIRNLRKADVDELMGSLRRHCAAKRLGTASIRFEYINAPLTVWPTVNAREFIVAIAPREYDRPAVLDVGRTLQKVVMDATRMGVGTCWIGPGADHQSIIGELGDRIDATRDNIICVVAVGYASRYIPLFVRLFNARFNRRLPLEQLFFEAPGWEHPLALTEPPYDRFGRIFEICQWAPSSYNGQTTRCVSVRDEAFRNSTSPLRFDFYATTSSRYYAAVALGIWCANWELGCGELDIDGHWEFLHGIGDPTAVPRYDISWIGAPGTGSPTLQGSRS